MENRNRVMKLVRETLQDKVFVGKYTERRLVSPLLTYKDVIEVDPKEIEFINTLKIINEKLRKTFDERFVSSIVGSKEEGFSILTNLSDVAFGSHWFKIKNVALNDVTITIDVKWLRSSVIESEPLTAASLNELWNNFNISKILFNLVCVLSQVLTKENIIYTARFLSAVFLSVVVGLYHLLELFLRFFNELNNTLKVLQPVFIACIEGLTKAFGGLLILITYLWKGESAKNPLQFQNMRGNIDRKPLPFIPKQNYQGFKNQMNGPNYGFNNRYRGYQYQRNFSNKD